MRTRKYLPCQLPAAQARCNLTRLQLLTHTAEWNKLHVRSTLNGVLNAYDGLPFPNQIKKHPVPVVAKQSGHYWTDKMLVDGNLRKSSVQLHEGEAASRHRGNFV